MAFALAPLPYGYDALEPFIDTKTMDELRQRSKFVMGFYLCKNCGKTCCDGLDIDYSAPECTGTRPTKEAERE